jgi:hypothetical protein
MGGGVNGAKLKFVEEQYACRFNGQGDHLFCIITDRENVRTFAARGAKASDALQMQQTGKAILHLLS